MGVAVCNIGRLIIGFSLPPMLLATPLLAWLANERSLALSTPSRDDSLSGLLTDLSLAFSSTFDLSTFLSLIALLPVTDFSGGAFCFSVDSTKGSWTPKGFSSDFGLSPSITDHNECLTTGLVSATVVLTSATVALF